ncbi:hypothetical protein GCM10020220_114190 [Nonomuraea rubra]|uniref:pyridoxal-dependent decarboxylase n=1 Tax=Nonomuraea rubra TaxID=46180 RepID=UPI0031EC8B1A
MGVQGMLWVTSPACTELETVVVDWLAELIGLPERVPHRRGGRRRHPGLGASACLVALLAALHRASGGAGRGRGHRRRYTLYVSSQTHSSLEKAARIAGLGAAGVRVVDVDPRTLAMDPAHLRELLAEDEAAGAVPRWCGATVARHHHRRRSGARHRRGVRGSAGSGCTWTPPTPGSRRSVPSSGGLNDGRGRVRGLVRDEPHKWLLTNFDCGVLWTADRGPLPRAVDPAEYLRNTATSTGSVVDYRDWQVPLGRRFRALKL